MISKKLLNPQSIVIVGGSNETSKPGGKVLQNLLESNFTGDIYVVNPKMDEVQGVKSYLQVEDLPQCDLAILAIAAKYCPHAVEVLAKEKGTGGFIILSAGFGEESEEGARLEKQIVETIHSVNGTLIGPNCTGFLNTNYCGAFDEPRPPLNPKGIEFITGSGATAVFIKEYGMVNGLSFNSVWAVGNSAQTGIEEVLEHLDETFDPEKSSKVIMLYMENIRNPKKLLKHATSLIDKGCKIAAIKSGSSSAGSRAASSHTGALATSDVAVDALFRKAGIVRCHNREELTTVCAIFMHPEVHGKNIAVITHAGGPAVMLTDTLSNGGMNVPHIEGPAADELLTKLFPGSSVGNPIDFLATGTAEQLGIIIDYCNDQFDNIDAMCVIFGSPGLFSNWEVYKVLDEKMKTSKKPIFPILPSIVNVKAEIEDFIQNKHRINFPEECVFGNALTKISNTPKTAPTNSELPQIDAEQIRKVIDNAKNGYISPEEICQLLDAARISRAGEAVVTSREDAVNEAKKLGFPLVMKVVGPVHKSDVGGVVLNVKNVETVAAEFDRMIKIPETTAILMQPMLSGTELFVGAKKEDKFGTMVLAGLGGIFIEVLKDVNAGLAPLSKKEALWMIDHLRGYKILKGVRGQEEVNIDKFVDIIVRVSALVNIAPEIAEMDLNPLLGRKDHVTAVDARIRIEK
ncbi:MAG: acetate--CoA ligase family protein [Bacteroidales bacterium]|jgi:acetyltransferase|nr:acetate--CoA ligase family protein [Bacteroidales bacterium]